MSFFHCRRSSLSLQFLFLLQFQLRSMQTQWLISSRQAIFPDLDPLLQILRFGNRNPPESYEQPPIAFSSYRIFFSTVTHFRFYLFSYIYP